MIDTNGSVIFKGQGEITKRGLFTGSISKITYRSLAKSFSEINFDALKSTYTTLLSDQQTVTTTFVKDGKIQKTIYDYGRIAPLAFKRAYASLESLYKHIPLKKISNPQLIPEFDGIVDSHLTKDGMTLDLRQSETFLLFDYLRNGKISKDSFQPRFKLHTYFEKNSLNDIATDGRYYTFIIKGKPTTIDIGFNFYDVNAKNWVWRKKTEHD